jgi:predicted flap endonuclease-1-like 5' DNA nuclease
MTEAKKASNNKSSMSKPAAQDAAAKTSNGAEVPGGKKPVHKGYKIDAVEGIGPKYAEMLRKAGISRSHHLLEKGASRKGRKDLATTTGLDEAQILKWTNMCDLMRIKGVGEEFSELLEAAGVDTVKELAQRKAENLHKAMMEANGKRKMVRQLPSLKQTENWVAQAKTMTPVMTY